MRFGPLTAIRSPKLAKDRGLMLRIRKPGREEAAGRTYLRVTCEDGYVRLGEWATDEAEARYWQGVARWVATGCRAPFTKSLFDPPAEPTGDAGELAVAPDELPPVEPTVGDLVGRYVDHFLATRIREDRDYSSTIRLHQTVGQLLLEFLATRSRGEHSPVSVLRSRLLHEFRDWIVAGYRTAAQERTADRERRRAATDGGEPDPRKMPTPRARSTVNRYMKALRRMIRWGFKNEITTRAELDAIDTMDALRARETQAREPKSRRPVPDDVLLATCDHLPATYAVLAKVQRLTGVRPGEILALRAGQVDTTPDAHGNWTVTQTEHKNDDREDAEPRVWWLNAEAQELIRERLVRCGLDDFVFTARDAHRDRLRSRGVERELTAAELSKFPPHVPEAAYREAVARACIKAGVPRWTPHQLRHSAATAIREASSADDAQAALGHGDLRTTERYARLDRSKGSRAIATMSLAG